MCLHYKSDTFPFSTLTYPINVSLKDPPSEISIMFNNLRYLHLFLGSHSRPYYPRELEVLGQSTIVNRHDSLSKEDSKSPNKWAAMVHFLESRRFAALIYINVVHSHLPLVLATTSVRGLKNQLITHYHQGEVICAPGLGVQLKPSQALWVLWTGAVFAQGEDEVDWFAQRIARGCRFTAVRTWFEMERQLEKICWRAKLRTWACRAVWVRVEEINRGFGDRMI